MADRFNLRAMQKHVWEARAGRSPEDRIALTAVKRERASKIRKLRTEAIRMADAMHKSGALFSEIVAVLKSRDRTEAFQMREKGVTAAELKAMTSFRDRIEERITLPVASVRITVQGRHVVVPLYDD